jgi:hypothetical protein
METKQMPTVWHELKTDPDVFDAVADGRKTHEIRCNDRDFKVGDGLLLRRTRYTGRTMSLGMPLEYTGEELRRVVSHVLLGPVYGIKDGWAILSFAPDGAGGVAIDALMAQVLDYGKAKYQEGLRGFPMPADKTLYGEICAAATRLVAPVQPQAPSGYALVPLRMTQAMVDVIAEEGWQWEDLLAVAEAITEEQYDAIGAAPMPAPTPRMLTDDEQQDLYFNAAKTPPQYAIAIQRRFMEVNAGLTIPAGLKETS